MTKGYYGRLSRMKSQPKPNRLQANSINSQNVLEMFVCSVHWHKKQNMHGCVLLKKLENGKCHSLLLCLDIATSEDHPHFISFQNILSRPIYNIPADVHVARPADWRLVWYSCISLNRCEALILYSPHSTAQKPVIPKSCGVMEMNTSGPQGK